MRRSTLCAAALAGFFAFPVAGANALPVARPDLGVAPMVEKVACVMRRVRTQLPNGRVVVRTVRECGRGMGMDRRMGMGRPMMERCRVIRERVERPNGTVVIRNVRRCR